MRVEQERFRPGIFTPPWVRHQHLERYRWAGGFVPGQRVLDAACGTGYGTARMAEAGAARVDGFDRCLEAVAFAARNYARPEVNFAVAPVERLPVPDRSYDIYV